MSGGRQPTDLILANGRKHLSKAEEAERRSHEVTLPKPKTAKPPKWLPEPLYKDFRALGKELIAAGLYTTLDADNLGRYLVAHQEYLKATKQLEAAFAAKEKDPDLIDKWGRVQERHFKQARQTAESMGLTVTSRCRLVVPTNPKQKTEESNPFLLIRGGKEKYG